MDAKKHSFMMAIAVKMIDVLELKLEIHGQDKLKLEPMLADLRHGILGHKIFS